MTYTVKEIEILNAAYSIVYDARVKLAGLNPSAWTQVDRILKTIADRQAIILSGVQWSLFLPDLH